MAVNTTLRGRGLAHRWDVCCGASKLPEVVEHMDGVRRLHVTPYGWEYSSNTPWGTETAVDVGLY